MRIRSWGVGGRDQLERGVFAGLSRGTVIKQLSWRGHAFNGAYTWMLARMSEQSVVIYLHRRDLGDRLEDMHRAHMHSIRRDVRTKCEERGSLDCRRARRRLANYN